MANYFCFISTLNILFMLIYAQNSKFQSKESLDIIHNASSSFFYTILETASGFFIDENSEDMKHTLERTISLGKGLELSAFQLRQTRNIFKQWARGMNESDYDRHLIPKLEEDTPVEITVSIMIIRVHSVSDASMDFGLEMYYRERWHDYRLAYDPKEYDGILELNLPMAALNYIWRPDTYFLNAISADVDSENSVTHRAFFRLNSTGHVHYSRKISLKADCPMELSMYPFDKQYCILKLGTYSHSSDDLVYNWAKPRGHDIEVKDPKTTLRLPEFYAEKPRIKKNKIIYTTGSFETLELCLVFKRSAGFCVLQVFIPATAVVMSSWVALWMAEDTTFSDVLAVILAIIFLAFAYNSVMPRVSYVKLLDLYMCSCFLFVFLSLAKLVIIKYFCKKWAKEGTHSSDWFLAQLAGISMAQAVTKDEPKDVEKADHHSNADSDTESSSSENKSVSTEPMIAPSNGPILFPKPADPVLAPAPNLKLKRVRIQPGREGSNSEDDDYKSANERGSFVFSILNKDKTSEHSSEIDQFLEMPVEEKHEKSLRRKFFSKRNSRMTFLGLEAWSAWFNEKAKKKRWNLERKMKYLRWFHVATQLALPIGFAVFFIFLLFVYPNVPDKRGC